MVRKISIGIVAAAVTLAASLTTHAAGLGKLTVLSPLGQPLNAEIEVLLQPGEEDGLSARLASPEAFTQAGIPLNSSLIGMRFAIERRDGRTVLRLTTPQAVNEPFVEMLVELQSSTGRLVREYTFLLDPPGYGSSAIAAVPAAPATVPAPAAAPKPVESKPIAAAPAPASASAPTPAPAARAPAARTHEVKRGDTLGAIARQNLAAGVTLNQMLIALYRANPEAFIQENVNLVRAGRILNIPQPEVAEAIDVEEANRLVRAQASEFAQYRSRLAAAPAAADSASGQRAVSGRIEPRSEAPAPADSSDQLKLSKVDPKSGAAGARAARQDDAAARSRELQEAQSRVADLEKNLADLQKLLELKNQQLAELEKKAGAPAAAVAPQKPAAPAKPAAVEAAKPAAPEAPKPAAEPTAAAAPKPPAEAAKPAAEAPKPAAEAAKAAPKPKPKAKPVPPPPPPPEPSLVDEFLENPVALGGLGLIVVLLVGYGAWAWRRKKAAHARFQDAGLGAAAAEPSFAGAATEPSPEAQEASMPSGAAAATVAGMETEEVDPIAEADVYMAYGRDAQAEEILKEALQKDPGRVPVQAKLLEIYAARRDAKTFEAGARKLKEATGGAGPEWEKVAALGASIDPQNALYGGATPSAAPAAAAVAAAAAAAAPSLDFDLGGSAADTTATDIPLDEGKKDEGAAPGVDFDLGAATAPGTGGNTDFTPEGTLIMESKPAEATVSGLDFDLNMGEPAKPEVAPAAAPAAAPEASGLDFDLNLDLGGDDASKSAEAAAPAADLGAISLDLDSPVTGAGTGLSATNTDPKWQEVATKLDLAKAYEEMGDKDGARELLSEVMKDGDAEQKGQAEQMLAKLG